MSRNQDIVILILRVVLGITFFVNGSINPRTI
jgi:uncharacterized membrane protein YphA (DoxX/SURF4 family)